MDDASQTRLSDARGPQDEDRQLRGGISQGRADGGASFFVLRDELLGEKRFLRRFIGPSHKTRKHEIDALSLIALGAEIPAAEFISAVHELVRVVTRHDGGIDALGYHSRDQFQARAFLA